MIFHKWWVYRQDCCFLACCLSHEKMPNNVRYYYLIYSSQIFCTVFLEAINRKILNHAKNIFTGVLFLNFCVKLNEYFYRLLLLPYLHRYL